MKMLRQKTRYCIPDPAPHLLQQRTIKELERRVECLVKVKS
jgi:hypothetical protein